VGATSSKSIGQGLSANLVSSLSTNVLNSFNFGWNKIYANFKCTGLSTLDGVSPLDQFGNGRDYNMDPFTSFGCLSLVSDSQFRKTGTTSYGDNISWVHGAHTLKFGMDLKQTRLLENFGFGITDPAFNSPCIDNTGSSVPDPTVSVHKLRIEQPETAKSQPCHKVNQRHFRGISGA